jgi:hypothetical protein
MSLQELLRQWEEWAGYERAAAGIAAAAGNKLGEVEGTARAEAIETCVASVRELFRVPADPHRN